MAEENPPQGANPEQANNGAEDQQILDDLTLLNQQGGGNLDASEQANLGGAEAEDDPTPGLSMQTVHQGSTQTTEQIIDNLPLQGEVLTSTSGVAPTGDDSGDLDIPPFEANSFTPDVSGSSDTVPEGGFFTALNDAGVTPGLPGGTGAPGAGPTNTPTPPNTPPGGGGGAGGAPGAPAGGPGPGQVPAVDDDTTEPPTQAPTEGPSEGSTEGSTDAPTQAPTDAPTQAPTDAPTQAPTDAPTQAPTDAPTQAPTDAPTQAPTDAPTQAPTDAPTQAPTDAPTDAPTQAPTDAPTQAPTDAPTQAPTDAPTQAPTDAPTQAPTDAPTQAPTDAPTQAPTDAPTHAPTDAPTHAPTDAPTQAPTDAPTQAPTDAPTDAPTQAPTDAPTQAPTDAPTQAPTDAPTQAPTDAPTQAPTDAPTQAPTDAPTQAPTDAPTQAPTDAPTQAPTQASTDAPTQAPTQPPTEPIDGEAETPTVHVGSVTGAEDNAIPLNIDAALGDLDGSETLSVAISNVPSGAVLSAGTDNGDGTWTLTGEDLDGLTIKPPSDYHGDFSLSVVATSTESGSGDTASTATTTFGVTVTPVLDNPELSLGDAVGTDEEPIALNIGVDMIDTTVAISDVVIAIPPEVTLSAGTDNGDGTWTVNKEELEGLALLPPPGFTGDIDVIVTANSTDGGSTTNVMSVHVQEQVDVTVEPASGTEDGAISLEITADPDATIVIDGLPEGAALSAGTDNGDGTWTVTGDQLNGLAIIPPENFSGDFDVDVTVDGEVITVPVHVDAVADDPTLEAEAASGTEDQPIALDISANLTDLDGSESLSITISGVPEGAELSAGTDNGDGTWTLSADDLDGLTITPPADFSGDMQLTVTATSTETLGGDTATTTLALDIHVDPEADAPTLTVSDVSGTEDQPIALDLSAALTDSSETLSITISGVPDGAELSAGTDNGDGTWTLSADDLDGLTVTPPANSDGDFQLTVTATSTDGGDTATTVGTIDVSVAADADAPTLVVQDASGTEDQPIALDIASGLTDLDGSESLSITISGVPDGAELSAGTDNGDGTWTLSADDLDGLTVTPPANSDGDFTLTVTATSTDGGDTATTVGTIDVSVAADADAPTLVVQDASGTEDQPIALDIASGLTDLDGSESLSITISGVPDGAELSAGTDNGDGTWTLSADDLDGLTVTPPANSGDDFTLTVTATSTDGGDTATTVGTIDVSVAADADAPTLVVQDASGTEDQPIALDIASGLTDLDGSESLSITISGVPDGAELSAGTDNGDGTWTLSADDLEDLTITPPANSDGDFTLTVTATSTDGGDTATTVGTIDVSVAADADAPTLVVQDASGTEDQPIALDIASGLTDLDGSESLSITISGVPDGAELSAGTDNGDGTWTLSADDLDGLTVTPPANSSDDFQLTITATATESNGDTATTVGTMDVSIEGGADAPTLVVQDASGTEDQPIALDITSALTDSGETLSITISGVPDGAELSAGTDNGDGTWTLSADDLEDLTITPPANSDGDFQLTVTATSTDGGDTATTVGTIDVSVAADADAPTLVVQDASGTEDQPIALDIASGLTDLDGSESLSITISGVPDGAELSAGTDNGDGTWTLSADDLEDLTITPPANSDGDFTLTVTATSTDGGDTATTVGTIDVSVAADADAPTLVVQDASGTEDQPIALDIASGLTDLDGSESLSITISGVPDGAELSAGTDNGDGTWTLSADDLEDLTITPPANSDGDFTLTVTATSTDGSDTATTVGTIDVSVAADADAPTLVVQDASGTEDQPIALDLSAALTDSSETLSITISGVPDGAELSAGTDNGDGTWTLSADDLDGLSVTPPANSDGDFQLTVTATSTDGGDTATTVGTIDVSVAADADAPTLVVQDASGTEDQPIALDIASGLTDLDGSESLSITISGVPDGAELSAGTDNGDGTWTLSADDLDGLTVTPPANSDGDFTLTVTATSTDGGDTATTVGTIDVSVAADADAPTLVVQDASGTEDQPIALDIASALTDSGESLSITISGVPDGAELSAGTDNGDGTWTLSADDLDGLTVTPPANSDGDFQLTVTATSTDGGDTATTVGTIDVSVAADADAPTLVVQDASGTEDQPIALDIASALTDSGESLSITISGVPDGAELSAGTDNGDGTWTLSADDLDGLTVTPPANSDGDFQLTVTATSTDGGDTATTVGTIDVSVAADADAPTLVVQDTSGTEDQPIALDLSAALTDSSETLSITISGVPDGAELSAGTDNGDGTWTLSADDLDGLTVTPPANSDGDFTLTVTATSTDGGDTATTVGTIDVSVAADADAPTLTVQDASGTEDQPIALDIASGLTDLDGSESLSITISGVPDGAELSAGIDNGDGTWTLSADDLDGLTITPPTNSDGDFQLTVTATSTDGGDTATTVGTIDVSVAADADAPTLSVEIGAGEASTNGDGEVVVEYPLDITSALTDTDGSESLSITVDGLPDGAALSAGYQNPDGSWTLSADDLEDLAIIVTGDEAGAAFDLTITATATDGGDTASVSSSVSASAVDVDAAGATLNASDGTGSEDTAIALDIDVSMIDTDGSESMSITITGVPDGAALSAGTDNGDGTWTMSSDDLDGLTITPPSDSNTDFQLGVSVTTTESSTGDTSTVTGTIDVDVAGVADAPELSVSAEYVSSESSETEVPIAQSILDAADADSTITISGVPDGATLSGGTDNGDGTWTLSNEDLDGLTVTPADGSSDAFDLTVSVANTTDSGGPSTIFSSNFSSGTGGFTYNDDTFGTNNQWHASGGHSSSGDGADGGHLEMELGNDAHSATSGGFTTTITVGEDGTATMSFSYRMDMDDNYEDNEYSRVLVSVDGELVEFNGNDYVAQLNGGGDTGWQTVTINLGHLDTGDHTVTLGGYNNMSTESSEKTMIYFDNVSVEHDPDSTTTTVTDSMEFSPETGSATYDLDISSSLADTDGSESLSITISDLPDDAVLSAGTDNGDGTWTLSADDLDGLTVTVPADSGDLTIGVTATSTESDGDTATQSTTVTLFEPDLADGVTMTSNVSDPNIAEGATTATYTLDLSVTMIDTDGSESITDITVTGVPDGVTLSAGTDNGDGTWTLTTDDLDGLTMTADSTVTSDFQLSVGVTTTEQDGSTNTTSTLIEAEAPSFGVSLSGGSGSDIITGTVGDDTLIGGSEGEDALFGGGGNDTLYGASGTDSSDNRLLGGAGNDELHGADGTGDLLVGGSGNDEAWGGSGNDMYVFRQGDGTDTFHGGSGTDKIVLMGPNGIVTSLSDVTITMTSGSYSYDSYNKTVSFSGTSPQGYITMSDGSKLYFDGAEQLVLKNDVLFDDSFEHVYGPTSSGGSVSGGDVDGNYFGSDGGDTMTGGSADDLLMGGAGNDTLSAGGGNDIVMGEEGDDKIYAGSGDDFVDGGVGNDTIYGEGGNDTIYGGDGNDYIDGGTGNDTIYGGAGDDTIYGGDGNDSIDGGTGNDTIYGGSGDDTIDGGSGDDTIDGGSGNDTIEGGAGDDHVLGGSGDDLFIFGSGDGSDYFHGGDGWTDTIELSDVSAGPGGDSGWTLELDNGATFTQTEDGITFDNADVSGTITLADGSELSFEGVEKIEW